MDLRLQASKVDLHQKSDDAFRHHPKRLADKMKKGNLHRKERLEAKSINQRTKEKGKGKAIYRELVGRSGTNSSFSTIYTGVNSTSSSSTASFPSSSSSFLNHLTSTTASSSTAILILPTLSTNTSTSSTSPLTSTTLFSSTFLSSAFSSSPSNSLLSPPPLLRFFSAVRRPLKAAVAINRGEILVGTGTAISSLAATDENVAGGGSTLGTAVSQAIATKFTTQVTVDAQPSPSSTSTSFQTSSTSSTSSAIVLSTIIIGTASIAPLPSSVNALVSSIAPTTLVISSAGSTIFSAPTPSISSSDSTSSTITMESQSPTTSSSSSSDTPSQSSSSTSFVKIVPATLGSIFVVGLIILLVIILLRRRRRQQEQLARGERRQQFRQQAVSRNSWKPTRPERPGDGGDISLGEGEQREERGGEQIRSFGNGVGMSRSNEIDTLEGGDGDMSEINIGNLNQIGLALGGADNSEGLVEEAQTPWGKRSLRAVLGRGGRGSAAIYGSSREGGRARSMEKYRFDHSRGSSIERGTGGYNSRGGYQPPISPPLPSPPLPEFPLPSLPPSTGNHTPAIVDNLNLAPEEFHQFSDAASNSNSNQGHLLPSAAIQTGDDYRPVSYQFSDAPSNIDSPRDSLRQLPQQDSFFGSSTERRPLALVDRESSSWTIDRENSDSLAPKFQDPTLGRIMSRREQEEGIRGEESVDFGSSSESASEGAREFERRETAMKLEGTEHGEEIDPSRRVMKDDGSWW